MVRLVVGEGRRWRKGRPMTVAIVAGNSGASQWVTATGGRRWAGCNGRLWRWATGWWWRRWALAVLKHVLEQCKRGDPSKKKKRRKRQEEKKDKREETPRPPHRNSARCPSDAEILPNAQVTLEFCPTPKNLMGEDLSPLGAKDLDQLEHQLEASLKQIRSTRMQYMLDQLCDLQQRELLLFETNKSLRTRLEEITQVSTQPFWDPNISQTLGYERRPDQLQGDDFYHPLEFEPTLQMGFPTTSLGGS
ncbi:hypothetical protein KFK09_027080 [Dendrobium nobile]|uniref:K-box domain-containing protein n=1 Tax=Dendrobium nobile TaxID=94219 RepID=A0A8T3A9T9_DENNO|nr:hypothetical protein KFK09_027080 [Dendrobium nobile]